MKLYELIEKHNPNFNPISKIHRKDNIKPHNQDDLIIYFSHSTLELVILPKNQLDENNKIILPSNADLLVKYNYHIVKDIDINFDSFLNSDFIDNENFIESLSNFFYKYFN